MSGKDRPSNESTAIHARRPGGVLVSRGADTVTRRAVGRYLGSIAAIAAAVLLRSAFDPVLQNRLPFATVVATLAGIIWFAGVGPSIVAALVGYFWAEWL